MNKNLSRHNVILLLSGILIISSANSCASTTQISTSSSTQVSPFTPTFEATDSDVPRITRTSTKISTEEPTVIEVQTLIPVCQGLGKSIPYVDNIGFNSTIIYQSIDRRELHAIGDTPITTSQLPIPNTHMLGILGISPDGNWLAYSPEDEFTDDEKPYLDKISVNLLSVTGDILEYEYDVTQFIPEIDPERQFIGIGGPAYWINNQLIYLTLYSQSQITSTSQLAFPLSKILNPFKGVWINDLTDELPSYGVWRMTGWSPDLERVIYEYSEKPVLDSDLVLWDRTRSEELWRDTEFPIPYGAIIEWSQDSSMVAYTNYSAPWEIDRRVFIASRNGESRKPITNETYPIPGIEFQNFNWSGDSRYLAMVGFLREGETKVNTLFIYDTISDQFTLQCPINDIKDSIWDIFWSPDNRYIGYTAWKGPINIIDLHEGVTIRLVDEGTAIGWSDKFPNKWP